MLPGPDPWKRAKFITAVVLALIAFLLAVALLKWILIGERLFSPTRVAPARRLDPVLDKQLKQRFEAACVTLMKGDLCGLALAHFGYNVQMICWRRDKSFQTAINPEILVDPQSNTITSQRTVGGSDPMCREGVEPRTDAYYDEVQFRAEDRKRENLRGSEARCLQKLMKLLNMSSPDDWPCTVVDSWTPLFMTPPKQEL
jgi:hypothetical protein